MSHLFAGSRSSGPKTWDIWTGRQGPTSQDRAVPAERFAAVVLGGTLRRSGAFWSQVDTVASAEDPGDEARRISAAYYVPNRSPGQAAVARLLELVGTAPTRRSAEWRLLNAAPGSYFPDAPLEPGMPSYALPADGQRILEEGARLVARRGAVRCLGCGTPLTDRYLPPTGAGRRERRRWRDYCDQCNMADWDHGRHRGAIRAILNGAAPVILGVEDRRRARRLRVATNAGLAIRP